MNYARFHEWVMDRVDELVREHGIPRVDADAIMAIAEMGCVAAEARARADKQFLLDFDRLGSVELGKRQGVSPQAVCKKRTKILSGLNPELNAQLKAAHETVIHQVARERDDGGLQQSGLASAA